MIHISFKFHTVRKEIKIKCIKFCKKVTNISQRSKILHLYDKESNFTQPQNILHNYPFSMTTNMPKANTGTNQKTFDIEIIQIIILQCLISRHN